MRTRCLIAFAVCLGLVACSSCHEASTPIEVAPELAAVDSLMWRQPDSALVLLLPCLDTCCGDAKFCVATATKHNRHYAHLLLAELLYKNDYGQSNRKDVLEAVPYFDSLTLVLGERPHASWRHCGLDPQSPKPNDDIAFLDARAHYINGVGYYERDSVVEACKEYLKALDVMEDWFEEKELVKSKAQFIALTYTRLTVLFSDVYLHEQAIYFGKKSLDYYNRFRSMPWQKAWMLTEIGAHYDMIDRFDTANLLYKEALQFVSDTNSITYRDIVTHIAVLSYKMGDSPKKSIGLLHSIIAQADSNKEYYSRCMSIGEIYYHQSQFDSAWYYLNKAFHESQNNNSKKQAAEWLATICKAQGKDTDALEYAVFLVPFANQEENRSAIKAQLTELYKSHAQREQIRLHRLERIKDIKWLIILAGGVVVLMSYITILYYKNKKRKQRHEEEIKEERQIHEMQQKALSGKLKKSNEALQIAMQQFDVGSTHDKRTPNRNFNTFIEAPICRTILETVHQHCFKSKIDYINYKEYALTKEQLLALRNAADVNMDGYTFRLRKRFSRLTDEDVTYCCFYLLDITDADIAALIQKAYPTVCERKRKIKRIIGEDNNIGYYLRNFP